MTEEELRATYLGKEIRLIKAGNNASHPSIKRELIPGDVVVVSCVSLLDTEEHLGFDIDKSLSRHNSIFGDDKQSLQINPSCVRYDVIELVVAAATAECTCRSLLFGHEPGCSYLSRKKS